MSQSRIKLCGMTRVEDVTLAVDLGVDLIGLIFAPRSKRRVDLAQAQVLRTQVPNFIGVVALLMDNPVEEVARIASELRPDYLQFHGAEDEAFCTGFDLPYFKAIAMGDGADPAQVMAQFPSAYGFVLDGHGAGEQGGSGKSFDWTRLPGNCSKPILLAGGLSADNVASAIRIAQPWGVDVSSGIESSPGVKDQVEMRDFVRAVRGSL